MLCSLMSCRGHVSEETGRVEVRAFHTNNDQRQGLKVDWTPDGEAVLHRECWNNMVQASDRHGQILLSNLEVEMVKEATKTVEFHDPDVFIGQQAKRVAQLLRQAEHPVLFTGAGISTAAGIGDYRGKHGKWTDQDKVREHGRGQKRSWHKACIGQLRPTYTHEAIAKLVQMDVFKHVISQNVDGLHRLSGVPEAKLSELHGNSFIEKCERCGTRYDITHSMQSDFSALPLTEIPNKRCKRCHTNHRTGRICQKKDCDGYLMNTIINFGDFLEDHILESAEANAVKADLFMCLGSTLIVTPANNLLTMGHSPKSLVICNRQATEFDSECSELEEDRGVRVHGDCDKLMAAIMKEILSEAALKDWQGEKHSRMSEYDMRRE